MQDFFTKAEVKVVYVLLSLAVLSVAEYTVYALPDVTSTVEHIITLLVLLAISVYIYFQPRAIPKTRDREISYYIIWLFICATIYLVAYFGCGFLFGFGRNPYDRSVTGVVKNVLFFGGAIVLKEWIRFFVINKVQKKNIFVFGLIIAILFTSIEVSIISVFQADNVQDITIEVCQKILPALLANLFLTYAVYIAGYVPTILYLFTVSSPFWLLENIPNLEWIVMAVLGITFPVIAFVALMEVGYNPRKKKYKERKSNVGNAVSWVVIIGFCVTFAFFTAGLFNTYPTVLVSNSMSPGINRGDVVVVENIEEDAEIEVGDIVLFTTGEYQVVHRIHKIYYEAGLKYYVTKGDANNKVDSQSIQDENILGVIKFSVPYIGIPQLMFESDEKADEINNN